MLRLIMFCVIALVAPPLQAQSCGQAEVPCQAPGGTYHIVLPDGDGPHPVVVFLHGFGGTGNGVVRNRGLLQPILDRGYAVIAPQGLPFREGMKGGSWNSMKREAARDDVAFLTEVLAAASAVFPLSPDRTLLTGFSGGAMMTWRVACDAPERFAAYAPIAGMLWLPLPDKCEGPFYLHHTHGWSDPVVPIEGRSVASGQFTQGNIFIGFDLLRDANGCLRDDPDEYGEVGIYLTRQWTDCTSGTMLEMALHPGGHSIPPRWSALALDWFERIRGGN
ncbi:MAG: alpha/beta fold hydrolase [Pseudomonadota bacterium]